MESDRAESEQARNEWIHKRWDRERGVETFDYNNHAVFVLAPVEDVGRALASQAIGWERDVIGREIRLGRTGCFLFRLRGHNWTEITDDWSRPVERALGRDWVKSLSGTLKTRAIDFTVSDTAVWVGYSLCDSGRMVEEFSATEADSDEQDERDGVINRPDLKRSVFSSERRPTTLADIGSIWDFTHDFFVEQDAFDPGIEFRYFLGYRDPIPNSRVEIRNPGFVLQVADLPEARSIPGLERVDYLEFRSPNP